MSQATPITVAHGDGIGPEIMPIVLEILDKAGAQLAIETIDIGEQVYLRGNPAGIDDAAWESIYRTRVFLKAPITTPQGRGYQSLNVATRIALGLYANVRPASTFHPYVETKHHPDMDVVLVRENEEDLYAGIEHRQTADVMQSLKLITRPGSERVIRFAFEYALHHGRKKVTAFAKDNIMKLSDGLFHEVFDEVAADYPDLENEYWIVDIGAAKLADTPRDVRRGGAAQPLRRHPVRRGGPDRRVRWTWGAPPTSATARQCSKRCTAPRRAAPARTWPTPPGCSPRPS